MCIISPTNCLLSESIVPLITEDLQQVISNLWWIIFSKLTFPNPAGKHRGMREGWEGARERKRGGGGEEGMRAWACKPPVGYRGGKRCRFLSLLSKGVCLHEAYSLSPKESSCQRVCVCVCICKRDLVHKCVCLSKSSSASIKDTKLPRSYRSTGGHTHAHTHINTQYNTCTADFPVVPPV